MNKTQLREQIAFANATAAAMRELGAVQTRDGYANGPDSLTAYAGEFTLNTKAGPLVVQAYGDAIMTRFEDPAMGARYTSASLSGKWNFHMFLVGIDTSKRGQYDRERKLLACFLRALQPILLAPGSPPVPARDPDAFDRELHRALIGRNGYASHDFATRGYFMKTLLPSMRNTAKREGVPVQAAWRNGCWQIWTTKDQPTGNAFVIVDVTGKWQKGPKFNESVISE